jgi:hypothetical protein
VLSLVQAAEERTPKLDPSSTLAEAREALGLRDESSRNLAELRASHELTEARADQIRQAIASEEWTEAARIMEAAFEENIQIPLFAQSADELERALFAAASAELASAPGQLRSGFATPASEALTLLRFPQRVSLSFWSTLKKARADCLAGQFEKATAAVRSAAPGPGTALSEMESAIRTWQASSARARTTRWVAVGLPLVFAFGLWMGSILFKSSSASTSTQSEIEDYVAEREAWHADKGSDAELHKALELVRRWRARYPQSRKLKDLEETVQRRIDNP